MTGPQDAYPQDAPLPDAPLPDATLPDAGTLTVSGPVTASVTLPYGTLRVRAEAAPVVTVRVSPTRAGRRPDEEAAQSTRVRLTDGRVDVTVPHPRRVLLLGRAGSVEVEVTLPEGSSVRLDAGYAAVDVTGRLATGTIATSYGDVRVDDADRLEVTSQGGTITTGRLTGPSRIRTTYGQIRVQEVAGAVELAGSTGDIDVARTTGDLTARLSYGQIRVEELVRGSASLSGSYGAVTVGIPTGTAAYLDVRSDHGRVRSELERATGPRADAERASLRARTTYGDITIRRP